MQIPLLTQCCHSLKSYLQQVEESLYKGAIHRWQIDTYAVDVPWSIYQYKDLCRWKRILTKRSFNRDYLSCFTDQDLITALTPTLYGLR